MKYRCKKGFLIKECDDDGFFMKGYKSVEEGDIYEQLDTDFRVVGGNETIRMESDNGDWLEIAPEHLAKYFEPVNTKSAS